MKKFKALLLSSMLLIFSQGAFAVSGGGSSEGMQYVAIDPPLVVNITDGNNFRFMQVSAQFKVANAEAANAINKHISAVRHTLLMLLGDQNIRDVYTTRGKEKLRQDCLSQVKDTLKDYTDIESIQNLYFTGFIVQ